MARATAVDPLGGGNWEGTQEEVEEVDPLASAPANPLFGSRKREFPGLEPAPKKKVALLSPVTTLGYAEWGLMEFTTWAAKLEGGIAEALQEKQDHAAILEAVPAPVRAEFGLPGTCPAYVWGTWIQPESEHVKQLTTVFVSAASRGPDWPASHQGAHARSAGSAAIRTPAAGVRAPALPVHYQQ